MAYRSLHDSWTLRPLGNGDGGPIPAAVARGREPIPATVPGCVHTDLLAADLIDDPYLDDNEERQAWIGRTAWSYETRVLLEAGAAELTADRTDLVCEGLDTVATVLVNGAEVGRTANMHRSYRFPVEALLRPGENLIEVIFESPYAYAEKWQAALGTRPGAYDEPYPFIRKMACNFGWDWGPTLVTSGIWRPIGLHSWSTARVATVRPLVTVVRHPAAGSGSGSDSGTGSDPGRLDGHCDGRVDVHVSVERPAASAEPPLTVLAEVAGVTAAARLSAGEHTAHLVLEVPEPRLWWPRGHGDRPRYPLTVTLAETGETWRRDIGFRDVRLDTEADAEGSAFRLVVNDVPIAVKGANWIPDDCFPSRVGPRRIAERLDQASGAGLNLLRVWGGGLYESEAFYDAADARGLMVWQDFPFACAAYPEEQPFHDEVEAEARENVVRLMPHPSLVLWCGNNENIEGFHEWGWRERLAGRSWGEGVYFGLLPRVVGELDPTRPYWPGSPYSGSPGLRPNDPAHGTVHIWDVWNQRDYTHYASYRPRFVAEYGFQGPPAHATLSRAVSDRPLTPDTAGVRRHQKAIDGNAKLARGLEGHLPPPADFDDWHFLTQLNQARAVSFAIEHFRALAPHCSGNIVWQLNDCWPVISWAAIDGDGRRKPLWYALRRANADRLLTIQPRQDGYAAFMINDTGREWSGRIGVCRADLAGHPLAEQFWYVDVPPRSVRAVGLRGELYTPEDPAGELLVAELDGVRTLRLYGEDVDMALPEAEFDAVARPAEGGVVVTVTARTLVRDLALFPDRIDPRAEVDDMLVTLLPGETATFTVTGGRIGDPLELTAPPVLRCVNERPFGTRR